MSKGTKEFLNDISIKGLVANNSLGANNQILTSNGSVVYWGDNQSGEMGARGFTGSRGDTGFAGSLGFTGSRGDIGANGNQGFTGSRGTTGFSGSQGIQGVQGPQGFTGSRGEMGFTGSASTVQGPQGFSGSQGIQGVQGTVGFTGSRGTTGTTGFTGSQGIQGVQGTTGSAGLNGANGNQGFTGSQGIQGVTGFTGSQGSPDTPAQVLSKLLTVDGSGSGLDADLWDGNQFSTFINQEVKTTSDVLFESVRAGHPNFGVKLAYDANANASNPLDGGSASVIFGAGLTNIGIRPRTGTSGARIWLFSGDGTLAQEVQQNGIVEFPVNARIQNNNIWHAGNDGSGSGLDADLWDGNQFSTFINQEVKTTSDVVFNSIQATLSGFAPKMLYDVNANASNPFDGGAHPVIFGAGFGSIGIRPRSGTSGTNIWLFSGNGTLAQSVPTNGIVDFPVGARIQNNNIWHAGNDGSGSGLDADLWDGNQFSTFINQGLRTNSNVQFNLLSFPSATAQKINLFSGVYGIGVQGGTQYFRTGFRFSWFKGGSHHSAENNAGTDGTVQMTLDSNANLTVTGEVISSFSDIRLKNDLGPIENVKDILTSLRGFYFEANSIAENLGYTRKREIGLSAQDVNKVLPELIGTNGANSKYMTVKYDRIVPVLIEGFKLQQNEIEDLKSTIKSLKSSIENL